MNNIRIEYFSEKCDISAHNKAFVVVGMVCAQLQVRDVWEWFREQCQCEVNWQSCGVLLITPVFKQ